jgi:hypothetical protein
VNYFVMFFHFFEVRCIAACLNRCENTFFDDPIHQGMELTSIKYHSERIVVKTHFSEMAT